MLLLIVLVIMLLRRMGVVREVSVLPNLWRSCVASLLGSAIVVSSWSGALEGRKEAMSENSEKCWIDH